MFEKATDDNKDEKMTKNRLEEIATAYMQVWSAGKQDLLDKYADKNLVIDYPHFEKPFSGIAECKSMLEAAYSFFPDISITVEKIIPNKEDNSVTLIWEYAGTHKQGSLFGTEPSGRKVLVRGMTLLEFLNGKVVRETGIVDNFGLLMQLK
jgi:predicted ester cyclase